MDTPVKYVKGVGEKRAELLAKLGIFTLGDLVSFYPRTYLDFSSPTEIKSIIPDTVCCFSAVIGYRPVEHKIRGNMTLYVVDGDKRLVISYRKSLGKIHRDEKRTDKTGVPRDCNGIYIVERDFRF